MRPVIISLFDFTGEAVRPWAEAGYEAACYDIQHEGRREAPAGDGLLVFNHWNADKGISEIASEMEDRDVRFVFSFTPCTDLTGAGSRHWESKSSPMWAKLGGKSLKTKNIRSASPRGFFKAVFEANR